MTWERDGIGAQTDRIRQAAAGSATASSGNAGATHRGTVNPVSLDFQYVAPTFF